MSTLQELHRTPRADKAPKKSLDARFRTAAKHGKLNTLQTLLRQGARIEAQDRQGRTPLVIAGLAGQARAVEWLVVNGASAEAMTADNVRFWQWAVRARKAVIVVALYRAGTPMWEWGQYQKTEAATWLAAVLDAADQAELDSGVLKLIRTGSVADVQQALLDAVERKRRDGKPTTSSLALLQWAAAIGNIPMLEMLLALPPAAAVDLEGGNEEDEDGIVQPTALLFAAQHGHLEVVHRLLALGANTKARAGKRGNNDKANGKTALHWAAAAGHSHVVEALLRAGADIEARDWSGGNTALMLAANAATASALITAGADFEARNWNCGNTALTRAAELWAAESMLGNQQQLIEIAGVAEVLYRAGASLDAENGRGAIVRGWLPDPEYAEWVAMIQRIEDERALEAAIPTATPRTGIRI